MVGETPVVDVQNAARVQRILDDEVVAALPASRGYGNLLATQSGIQANGIQNSGIAPDMIFFTSRGGRSNEGTVQIDGMNVGSAFNGGGVAGYGYDTGGAAGGAGHRGWRPRRGRPWRPGIQPHSQDRRQQLQRHLLRQHRRRMVAGQQRRRRAALVRHPEPGRHHQKLGHQRRGGRADQEGQGLVLQHPADLRQLHRHRRPLRQRQCRQPRPLGLRGGSEHHPAVGDQPEDHRRAHHDAAHAAQQDQRLRRDPEDLRGQRLRPGRRAVPQPRRRLDRRRRLRQLVAGIDALARQLRDASCSWPTRRR